MRNKKRYYLFTVMGIVLLLTGFFLLRGFPAAQGVMQVLPFVCIGVGCGAFGWGSGELISKRVLRSEPELELQIEIEQNDERRILISERARARALNVMNYTFATLILCFLLMGVDTAVVLMLIAVYLFVEFYAVYQMIKLEKEL